MQSSAVNAIVTDAINTLQFAPADSILPSLTDLESDISAIEAFQASNRYEHNFFEDVDDAQIISDLKHHISRASSNYVNYNEYSPHQQLHLAAGMVGHIMHHRGPLSSKFHTNFENLAELIAPEYKENMHPLHHITYGGTFTDIQHNPGILNVIDQHHKAHSNLYHECLHRGGNGHVIAGRLSHLKHCDEICELYDHKHLKDKHEKVNKIKTPLYHNHVKLNSYSIENHHSNMKHAREQGDYKLRRKMHETFIRTLI